MLISFFYQKLYFNFEPLYTKKCAGVCSKLFQIEGLLLFARWDFSL